MLIVWFVGQACPAPLLVGKIPPAIVERAAVVCRVTYHGCTVRIVETGDRSYRVICRRVPPAVWRTCAII